MTSAGYSGNPLSWPKLSSRLSTGLREDDIRETALATGLVDI